MDDIATRIQAEMDRQDLSARGLSLKAGLSERHVGKILERGSGGGAEGQTLLKIANALGVSVAWLMTGESPPAELRMVPADDAAPVLGSSPDAEALAAEVIEEHPALEPFVRMVLNSGSMRSLHFPLTAAALTDLARVVQRHAERRRR